MGAKFEARRTHGSIAELVGGQAAAITKRCKRCDVLIDNLKTYCRSCSADSYDETVAANKARYRAQRLAKKPGE